MARYLLKRGMTNTELASRVGVSAPMPGRWVQGQQFPRLDHAFDTAGALGCELIDLLKKPGGVA